MTITESMYQAHLQAIREQEKADAGKTHPAAETHRLWAAYVDAHPRWWEREEPAPNTDSERR